MKFANFCVHSIKNYWWMSKRCVSLSLFFFFFFFCLVYVKVTLHTIIPFVYYYYFGTTTLSVFVKIISIPDEELFSERASGEPLHTLSKLYDVPVCFVIPLFLDSVFLYLRSPKGDCCSISEYLPCSYQPILMNVFKNYNVACMRIRSYISEHFVYIYIIHSFPETLYNVYLYLSRDIYLGNSRWLKYFRLIQNFPSKYWNTQNWYLLRSHIRLILWMAFLYYLYKTIFIMVSYFLHWTLQKFFRSIPDEQSQQKVRRLGRIICAVINTSNEVECPLLWGFWIYNFSGRILERVLVGNIVNIRNECLFFSVHGEWIVSRNKQIVREPLRGSCDLFVPRYDSIPMNREKETLIP